MSTSIKLAYNVFEPSVNNQKPAIILIHGISGNKESFDNITKDLAERCQRRVYAIDLRNHGESERSEVSDSSAMIQDIIQFLDDHGIQKAVFSGHSLGGRLSMILALTHPDRIDKIIIEDMTPKALPQETREAYKLLLETKQKAVEEIPPESDNETASKMAMLYLMTHKPEGALCNINFEALAKNKSYGMKLCRTESGKFTLDANITDIMKSVVGLGFDKDLEGYCERPALFIYGLRSEINVGNDKDHILKLFPQAELQELDASHLMHAELPTEFIEKVQDFLKD